MLRLQRTYDVASATSAVELVTGELLFLSTYGAHKVDKQWNMKHWVGHDMRSVMRDGPKEDASFGSVSAAAVDPLSGDVFLCDGCCLRRMHADGSVATVAGSYEVEITPLGPGRVSRFQSPWGLAIDVEGNVLVCDYGSSDMRKVTRSPHWLITTICTTHQLPFDYNVVAGATYHVASDTFYISCMKGIVSVMLMDNSCRVEDYVWGGGDSSDDLECVCFDNVYGIACDAVGNLLLCEYNVDKDVGSLLRVSAEDRTVTRLNVLDVDGDKVNLIRPRHPCITSTGDIIIPDEELDRVFVMSGAGLFVGKAQTGRIATAPRSQLGKQLWRMQSMGELCDCVFRVEGELIDAHKLVLTARSEYFTTMLCGAWAVQAQGDIDIGETTAPAFRALLSWLYTEQLTLDGAEMTDVLLLARRCLLPDLVEGCTQQLVRNMSNVGSALRLFLWAHHNYVDGLRGEMKRVLVSWVKWMKTLPSDELEVLKKYPDLMLELFVST